MIVRLFPTLAAAVLFLILRGAWCADLRQSPLLPRVGEHGFIMGRAPSGTVMQVQTYGVMPGAGETGASLCTNDERESIEIGSYGWLSASVSVTGANRAGLETWLQARSPSRLALSNGDLLRQIFRGLAVALPALAGSRDLPSRLKLMLEVVSNTCTSVRTKVFSPVEARSDLVFPILVQAPAMLGAYEYDGLFDWLTRLLAHELAHVIQLMPFDAERERWLQASSGVQIDNSGHHAQPLLELGAMMVEQCVAQSLVPRPADEQALAGLWVAAPSQFEALAKDGPEEIRTLSRLYGHIRRAIGEDVIFPEDPVRLGKLFGACAAVLRRPELVLQEKISPEDSDLQSGIAALSVLRDVGPQIFFHGRRYNSQP